MWDVHQGEKKEDFIYLDPPYVPENPQSFVKYTHDGFNLETHQELFQIVKQLHEKKNKLVLSNSNVPLVLDTFEPIQGLVDFCQQSS